MPQPARFLPALPTLSPALLLPRPGARPPAMPFADPAARYYYLARNGIWHAVRALGLAGGEVLAPAYHHGVEIEALIAAGMTVRFYPVDRRWQADLAAVERLIGPATRALYLTHYAGFPGPTAAFRRLADAHGLALFEDCALALFSASAGQPLGSTGDAAVFCLYKTLPVPNGGALVLHRAPVTPLPPTVAPPITSAVSHLASSLLRWAEFRGGAAGRAVRAAVRALGRHTVATARIERVTTGSDHFNPADAGLGISAISRRIAAAQDPARIVARRRRNYRLLRAALADLAPPPPGDLPPGVCPLFYPLPVPAKEAVQDRLEREGVETINFWSTFHPACDPDAFPDVAWLRRTVLEVPCHQDLTPRHIAFLAAAVRRAVREVA